MHVAQAACRFARRGSLHSVQVLSEAKANADKHWVQLLAGLAWAHWSHAGGLAKPDSQRAVASSASSALMACGPALSASSAGAGHTLMSKG